MIRKSKSVGVDLWRLNKQSNADIDQIPKQNTSNVIEEYEKVHLRLEKLRNSQKN